MSCEGVFFKLYRKSFRTIFHTLKSRPGSYPYITGDSFRLLADHIHDETNTFNPALVEKGDIVFVGNPQMEYFFKKIHPQIKNKYILIQHNGDNHVDENIAHYIDDKIFRFYAQISTVKHEKIISIPIGIENKHHGIEGFSFLMKWKIPTKEAKKPRIFFHFSVQTNPGERGPALTYFKTHLLMDTIEKFVPYITYKNILASYCFTVSPAGNTLGSHRTWEALYLRTIPVVKRTIDAESWVSLGLPIWIVDNWNELDNLSEQILKSKYEEMMENASFEAIQMDYWIKKIRDDQKIVQGNTIL
jgi:hypothetical protein